MRSSLKDYFVIPVNLFSKLFMSTSASSRPCDVCTLIPAYRVTGYIAEAIESALSQTSVTSKSSW